MEKGYFEDLGVSGRKILKWLFQKLDGCGLGSGQLASACEQENEPSCSIKFWQCLVS
jgi:hypothetical protein